MMLTPMVYEIVNARMKGRVASPAEVAMSPAVKPVRMRVLSIAICTILFSSGCTAKSNCRIAELVSSGDLEKLAVAVKGAHKKHISCEGKDVFSVAAASVRGYESAEVLLSAGIIPNANDESGGTSLHDAAMWADLKMVRLLVDNGMDPNARDGDGATPFDLAKERNDPDGLKIVEYLSETKGL